jgi:hypothetical protein
VPWASFLLSRRPCLRLRAFSSPQANLRGPPHTLWDSLPAGDPLSLQGPAERRGISAARESRAAPTWTSPLRRCPRARLGRGSLPRTCHWGAQGVVNFPRAPLSRHGLCGHLRLSIVEPPTSSRHVCRKARRHRTTTTIGAFYRCLPPSLAALFSLPQHLSLSRPRCGTAQSSLEHPHRWSGPRRLFRFQ